MDNGTADGTPDAGAGAGGGDKAPCERRPVDPAGPYADGPWRNYFLILLDRIPTPIAVCRAHGEVLIANPAMAEQWGTAPEAARPQPAGPVQAPRDGPDRPAHRGPAPGTPFPLSGRGVLARRDGRGRAGRELTIDPVGDPSVNPPALLALLRVRETLRSRPRAVRRARWRPGSWRWPRAARPRRRSVRHWG
ncbi:hypothetical protein O1L68_04260 [Streptomyces lydicus]|nr:hypothetical protein [Streptomyces lydicus]